MSENTIAALVAAIPPTLAAIAAVIVTIRGNAKVDQVHTLVNSQKEALEAKIKGLEKKLGDALRRPTG